LAYWADLSTLRPARHLLSDERLLAPAPVLD
jgi:hypothetical protein